MTIASFRHSLRRLTSFVLIVLAYSENPPAHAGEKPPVILRVASPEVPGRFAPGAVRTDADRQALDLLFEPLLISVADAEGTLRFRPVLAEAIPVGQGTNLVFRVRPSSVWSNGDKVTAADVRHSLRLTRDTALGPLAWSNFLEPAQIGPSPREIRVTLRHGLLQPWEWFSFPIVPHQWKGQELSRLDDPDFAKDPVGSGPFILVGTKPQGGGEVVVFRTNPHHPNAKKLPFQEIHWHAVKDAKGLDILAPDLVLGFDAETLGKLRNVTPRTILTRRVLYVAPNHRHPLLATPELRGFLAMALERDKVLSGVSTPVAPGIPPILSAALALASQPPHSVSSGPRLSVTGLTPRDSWTNAPPPRVPDDLFKPELARAYAKKITEQNKAVTLNFKFPGEFAHHATALIQQWQSLAQSAGLDLRIQPVPMPPLALAEALHARDFELILTHEDHGDQIGRLTALFDSRPEALAPGGTNILGVRDSTLQSLLLDLPRSRQFPLLREHMRNIHGHLTQTMPFIPLWQQQTVLGLGQGWRVGFLDPHHLFRDLSTWQRSP